MSILNSMLSWVEHYKSFFNRGAIIQSPLFRRAPGLEVIKLDFILRLKIKCNDWMLVDKCPQASNQSALIWVWDCTQVLKPRGQASTYA